MVLERNLNLKLVLNFKFGFVIKNKREIVGNIIKV